MTAIVGFHCNDGVVIAADTEESYGKDKAYTHKLFPVERAHSRLCVAGSGLTYLIEYANEQIVSAFDSELKNVGQFYSSLRDVLARLYAGPFKDYPTDSPAQLGDSIACRGAVCR